MAVTVAFIGVAAVTGVAAVVPTSSLVPPGASAPTATYQAAHVDTDPGWSADSRQMRAARRAALLLRVGAHVRRERTKPVPPRITKVEGVRYFAPPPDGRSLRERVMSQIHYPWQRLPMTISFEGPRDGYLGITDLPGNHIHIYVRPGESTHKIAVVTAYEIAHVVDNLVMNDSRRADYLRIRGASGTPWFNCDACSESDVGAGDYADAFAIFTVGRYYYVSHVAPEPSDAQLDRLGQFFQLP